MSKYQGWLREPISKHIEGYQSGIASGEKSREFGFAHLRMNNISTRFTLNQDEMWYIPASDEEKKKYSVLKGDLLFNNTNSDDLVGKSCVFELETDDIFLFSNHITRIRTKDSLDSLYLLYWIKSLWDKRFFKDNCTKWVNQAAVRPEDLLFPQEILLPPTLEEQRAIALDLQSQLAHVEIMRQAALKQKEAAKALQSAILREEFAGSENLSSIPIKKTGKIFTGYTPPRGELDNYGGQTPWIKPEDLDQTLFVSNSKEFISKSGLKKRRLLPINSILVSCIGNIGKMAIAGVPLVTNQQINSVIPNDDIDPLFLYFAIKFAIQNKKDINIALVSILNAGDFGKVAIPYIQGKEKQKLFAENIGVRFRQVEVTIKAIEKEIDAIEALPAAILREAFNFEGSR